MTEAYTWFRGSSVFHSVHSICFKQQTSPHSQHVQSGPLFLRCALHISWLASSRFHGRRPNCKFCFFASSLQYVFAFSRLYNYFALSNDEGASTMTFYNYKVVISLFGRHGILDTFESLRKKVWPLFVITWKAYTQQSGFRDSIPRLVFVQKCQIFDSPRVASSIRRLQINWRMKFSVFGSF